MSWGETYRLWAKGKKHRTLTSNENLQSCHGAGTVELDDDDVAMGRDDDTTTTSTEYGVPRPMMQLSKKPTSAAMAHLYSVPANLVCTARHVGDTMP